MLRLRVEDESKEQHTGVPQDRAYQQLPDLNGSEHDFPFSTKSENAHHETANGAQQPKDAKHRLRLFFHGWYLRQ